MEYFKEKEYEQARKQRKRTLIGYFVALGVYVILTVGLFLWYRSLEYKSSTI